MSNSISLSFFKNYPALLEKILRTGASFLFEKMKDKDEVSNLLAKLTIKNDLDREEEEPEDTQEEEEEEVVKSVEVVDDNGDGDGDEYVSKGPVR